MMKLMSLTYSLQKKAEEYLKTGEFISFEEVIKEAGISEKDLQDNI